MKAILIILNTIMVFNVFVFNSSNNVKIDDLSLEPASLTELNHKPDTLITKKDPFQLNNRPCYWEFSFIYLPSDSSYFDGKIRLKEMNTGKVLLIHLDDRFLDKESYLSTINKNFQEEFQEVNFDGYTDFCIYNTSKSGSGGAYFDIYLYNQNNETFELSEELSGGNPIIDKKKKTLTTFWKMGIPWNITFIHHFDQLGKLAYSESITKEAIPSEENIGLYLKTYQKIINGKIVYIKKDTTDNQNLHF